MVHLDVTTGHWEELRFPEDLRDFCLTDDGNVWAQDEASVFHANPEPGTVSDDSGFWQVPVREGAWRFQVVDIPRYTLQGTALPPFPNRLSCIGNHIALEANLTDDHHLLFWTGPTAFTAPLRSR
ncbi:MAG: hypothetical protein KC492_12575 [Myxococcales bacterium]|nr:hypothetical protein [Myxococcales bacterium]